MIDLIVGLVILAILALAIGYIIRAKKAGVKCIGCSCGGTAPKSAQSTQSDCASGCGSCSCHCGQD